MWCAVAPLYPDVQVSAKIPLAQAVNESTNFTSPVFEKYNNCFGMNAPAGRETTATNKGQGGYANFSSPLDCIRDFHLWLRAFNLLTDDALLQHIKAGKYAPGNKAYYSRIMAGVAALEKQGKYINPGVIAAVGLVGVPAAGMVAVKAISHIIEELT